MSLNRFILSKYCLKLFSRWSQEESKLLNIIAVIQTYSNPTGQKVSYTSISKQKIKNLCTSCTFENVSKCLYLHSTVLGQGGTVEFHNTFLCQIWKRQ